LVFQDKQAGEFLNSRFLCLRVIGNKGEGKEIRETYNVTVYPTVLFLNSNGEELDRICGFDDDKDAWLQTTTDYLNGKNILNDILSKVEKEPANADFNFQLAKKYVDRWEGEKAFPYYAKVIELDPNDEKGYKTESTFQIALYEGRYNKNIEPLQKFLAGSTNEKFLDKGYNNLIRYYKYMMRDTIKIIQTYEEALKKMPANTNWMNSYAEDIFQTKVKKLYDRGAELAQEAIALKPDKRWGYINLAHYYENTDNINKLLEHYEETLKILPEDARIMSSYAWAIHKHKIEHKYEQGLKLAQKAVEIDPSPGKWDTLAWLNLDLGNKQQAIKAIKKAIELNPDSDHYKENMKKIEESVS